MVVRARENVGDLVQNRGGHYKDAGVGKKKLLGGLPSWQKQTQSTPDRQTTLAEPRQQSN